MSDPSDGSGDDIEKSRLVCVIGVAPTTPA
jgi:hypothetical protein